MRPTDSDASLEQLVREHAALRRVPTLGAREPSPAGRLEIASPSGDGTRLSARLPTHVLGGLNGG